MPELSKIETLEESSNYLPPIEELKVPDKNLKK